MTRTPSQPSLWLASTALVTLVSLYISKWVWFRLYFEIHTLGDISAALGCIILAAMGGISVIHRILGRAFTWRMVNVAIALTFVYLSSKFFIDLNGLPPPTTTHKMGIAFVGGVTALLAWGLTPAVWQRLYASLVAGSLIFMLIPILMTHAASPMLRWPSPSHLLPASQGPELPRQNTIVLLLDEFSADAAEPVVTPLQELGLHVKASSIDPAGKNTLNVIPAIWSQQSFDQAVPCGPTQICSVTHVMDFAKVHTSSPNIDIVGFYHQYCAIQGLRHCALSAMPARPIVKDLICTLPVLNGLFDCKALEARDRQHWLDEREKMQKTLLEAPFWRKGGLLYGHLLTPHPLDGIPKDPLAKEYQDNIAYAAQLVKRVAQKATQSFGDDFRIIVFSDHPLRIDFWCQERNYASLGCTPHPEHVSKQVPLIVATPRPGQQLSHKIQTNQHIFDLLF